MNAVTPKFGVGASALRKEDDSLVRGVGNYSDDVNPDGQLFGYVVRSPYASATFTVESIEEAAASEGVHLILTAADLGHLGPVKCHATVTQADGSAHEVRECPVLCKDRVRFVGDAVAFVVADSLRQAQDAAELIDIDWQDEEAVATTGEALKDGAALVWPELGSNRVYLYHQGDAEATEKAFAEADHITEIEFENTRLVANYMEPRAAVAEWDEAKENATLWTGTQGVHHIQNSLSSFTYPMEKDHLRVVTGDVGGGFGTRVHVYREYPLVLEAAKRIGKPVKWVSDRSEHFAVDFHGRDNLVKASMALDPEGRFKALKIEVKANLGAYLSGFGPFVPTLGAIMATGVYDIQTHDMTIEAVYTNTVSVDAYRGAGRPEAALLLERLVDACARDIGMDPTEIRRRNFIQPEQFPYCTAAGRLYDVGEFAGHMDAAMERADRAGFEARAEEAKSRGRIRGFGFSTYVEACAFAGSEPAFMELGKDGTITLHIGTQANGQGHITAYSQFIAEKIGIDFDKIKVKQGDTRDLAAGGGTGGSRSIPLGGVSVNRASEVLSEKMRKIAAEELEAAPDDIELVDGEARIVGTDRRMSYEDIADKAKDPEDLKAMGDVKQDEATYPNGTHVCELEIDPETGVTEIVNYTIVDDFGVIVNPVLLLGQIHGGAVQGIGQCLFEHAIYSEDGQLLTASFMDYAMPRADNMPSFDFSTRNVPSTTNAMGIKGAGEAATIGSCPAVLNAVVDALDRAYNIRHIEMPTTPLRVWTAIQQAGG